MIALAFLIVSAIIGAGFVTGTELFVFFANAPLSPIWVALLVSVCLFLLMGATLLLSESNQGETPNFQPPVVIFAPLYMIFFAVMTAGIAQLLGPIGALVSLGACVLIVMFGFEKLTKLNKYLIWFVLAVLLIIAIPNIHPWEVPTQSVTTPRLILSALYYAGMNCMLFPIYKKARIRYSPKECIIATIIACIILGALVWLILSSMNPSTNGLFPIQNLNNSFLVKLAIFLSVFTSQFISLFNLDTALRGQRIPQQPESTYLKRTSLLALLCAIAFFLGSFGFWQLVTHVYPWVGLFMVLFLACALLRLFVLRYFSSRSPRR